MRAANGTHAVEAQDKPRHTADLGTIFLGGLFVLAMLTAAYAAADILLPFILASILQFLFQPALRWLERLHVPRILGVLLLIAGVFGTIVGLGAAISGPATMWAAKLPQGIPRLQDRLSFLKAPIDTLQRFLQQVEDYGGAATPAGGSPSPDKAPAPAAAPAASTGLLATLFVGARNFASGFFTTILFLAFLLAYGNAFLNRLVEVLPSVSDKRRAVDISQQIEHDVSAYLITITIVNAAVGILAGVVMWLTGVGDPILWGAVAFLLNYIPILGWLSCTLVFLLAGLLAIDTLWLALLPAGLYVAIHTIEGETLTPMLLARRFTLNPVIVVMAFVFWFWMWGVPGAVIAVPLLAVMKIVCDRIGPLQKFGHVLER